MEPLRAFGEEAEHLEFPRIDVGGFVVPGRDPTPTEIPGLENDAYANGPRAAREEAGPAAGAREGSPAQAAAPGTAPHTLKQRVSGLDLEGLSDYHPSARVAFSTSSAAFLNIPVGLFRTLPFRARLTLEIPFAPRERLSRPRLPALPGDSGFQPRLMAVPDVRAWAVWERGPFHGAPITSHHRNPDCSICACLPSQWIRGVHPLLYYVAFCIVWIAKTLHERELGFYPGLQHYGARVRVKRDRGDEYCGCGRARRYRDCHRAEDFALSPFELWRCEYEARRTYLGELAWQGRPASPPHRA